VTFHIEHVVPLARSGNTVLANLALSCPGCNLTKAQRITGVDAKGLEHRLFNPRDYEPWILGWHLHFALDRLTCLIVARTPVGEATVETLKMNDGQRSFARKLQIEVGLLS
jgi:hypothetical protein